MKSPAAIAAAVLSRNGTGAHENGEHHAELGVVSTKVDARKENRTSANGTNKLDEKPTGDVPGTSRAPVCKPGVAYINVGEDDQMEVYGYERCYVKTALTSIMIVLTCGLGLLVLHWKPEWMVYCTKRRAALGSATSVLLVEIFQKWTEYYPKPILTRTAGNGPPLCVPAADGTLVEQKSMMYFTCKKSTYIWDEAAKEFYRLGGLSNFTNTSLLESAGLSAEQQCQRRLVYGPNVIHIRMKSVLQLLFVEVLNPFYVFQLFSVCLWYSDEYYYYASAIVIMSAFGITSSIIQTRQNQRALRRTVHASDTIEVHRGNGVYEQVSTADLAPGDVITIPSHGCQMHCDAVLIVGNCIVNESALTGESVPVTKTPIPARPEGQSYDIKDHARHTLFGGTHVIQTRYYGSERVRAVVTKTGYATNKGGLVRAIMYPKPVDFKFNTDSYRFIAVLGAIAMIGLIYTTVTKAYRGLTARNIALDSLDLLTIVVPPALPAAMTVGIMLATNRLKKSGIFCISPRSVNVSGLIDCVCFDKTGTLTEDGLDLWGAVPVVQKPTGKDGNSEGHFSNALRPEDVASFGNSEPLIEAMASCHSLTLIDGQLTGDPLDVIMFESTSWTLEEPQVADEAKYDMIVPTIVKPPSKKAAENQNGIEIGIIRQFPFSSSLQRMSVIAKPLVEVDVDSKEENPQGFQLFCKGAPEKIVSLCLPETVPHDFNQVLEQYTEKGYRVLAVAQRPLHGLKYLKLQKMARDELECSLTLVGLIVMENRLKAPTTPVIAELKMARIRVIMVTGDNILTALSVARECGMVSAGEELYVVGATVSSESGAILNYTTANRPKDAADPRADYVSIPLHGGGSYHFAMTGKTFEILTAGQGHAVLDRLLSKCVVFARMSPEQKQLLVEKLQELGYHVGMCGDGANDCGALKAAHAGISLSEAEASVASPFTSKKPDISCVPSLVREGRAALVTSFGVFKYMAAYSLTQFISVMLLYSIDCNLTDFQFLYIDLVLITTLVAFFGNTQAYNGPLDKRPPPSALAAIGPVCSLIAQVALVTGFQVTAFFYIATQPWFEKFVPNEDDLFGSHSNYAVFVVSTFQYVGLVLIFSQGAPYRQPMYTNRPLTGLILALTALNMWLAAKPPPGLGDWLEVVLPPVTSFRWIMIFAGFLNCFIGFAIETWLVNWLMSRKCLPRVNRAEKSKKKFLALEKDMANDASWPPTAGTILPAAACSPT